MAGLLMDSRHRFRNGGFLCVFVVINFSLVYELYYLFRVHRWRRHKPTTPRPAAAQAEARLRLASKWRCGGLTALSPDLAITHSSQSHACRHTQHPPVLVRDVLGRERRRCPYVFS